MKFRDKVVWITGASSGIGEALAYAFYREGAHLILSARRLAELERVKNNNLMGSGQIYLADFDISKFDEVKDFADDVIKKFDHIDILINSAGVAQRAKIVDTNMEVYRQIMQVNYFGTVALTKAILPSMIDLNSGHIVFIGSPAGIFSTPLRSGYSASKHAIHSFSDSLISELANKNINVTNIIPGPIRTNMSISSLTGNGKKYAVMDRFMDTGISPSTCAEKILRGLAKKKEKIVVVNSEVRKMIFLKRYFPGYFSKVSKKLAPQ
jgi:short-subunit dehydrogenase